MSAADMAAWASRLRAKYGIIWPVDLRDDGDDTETPERITNGH